MNKKLLVFSALLFVLSVAVLCFSWYLFNRKVPIKPDPKAKIDTVYINKPFKPVPEYRFIKVPYLVTFWNDSPVKIDTVYVDSTRIHYVIPEGHVTFNHQFLVQYPESPKLVQMVTSKNTLEFTFLKPDGLIRTEKYGEFYPEVNYYNYQNNQLTYKRKPFFQRFEISPELMIRPLANMYDLNLGLKYKTRKIYYEIGLNSYYYPILGTKPLGATPYLRVGLTL